MSIKVIKGRHYMLPAILYGLLMNWVWADSADLERGRLLYENHCLICHDSQVHIRNNQKVHTLGGVSREVIRWSEELKLTWRASEINDVTQYLYRTFY
ncbi:MAG: hypothetical protein KZQ88_04815 [Candidatus Thiodiazotropha sp. (ex Dulcina madagascariensis)]|nr:hypothetical protein [Candidatus Thiodiazotropha sp. (ex Dulcina madagascariensis)]